MRNLFSCSVKICLLSSMFLFYGCTFYIFDPQYYKARKYAKKHSATYVINRILYDEIMQQKKDSKSNESARLALQEALFIQIKHNKNQEWLEKKAYYMELAYKHSGYYHEQNAQTLFVLDKINEHYPTKQILSNGKPYYEAYNYDGVIQIPESLRTQIGGITDKTMKFQQIIYPQFFYIDDSKEIQLISVGVVYLYTNINKVYGLKEDEHIKSMFANGEWLYLRKNNVKYLNQ